MGIAQKALNEYEAKPVQELIHNAQQLVTKLCERGPSEWVMSVPVRPDDSDIVLSAALTKAAERIAELERHNELLRAVARQTESLLNMSAGTSGGRQEVHDRVVALNKKYQAAIDGGALDGEK